MGFLDDVVGLFSGDIFFPGNARRAARFKELQEDCASFLAQEREISARTQQAIANMDQLVQQTFDSLQLPSLFSLEPGPLPTAFQPLPKVLLPLAQMQAVRDGCTMALDLTETDWQKSLSQTLGLPILPQKGETIFGVLPSLLVFGPLRGAQHRDNLRHAIHSSILARFKIRRLVEASIRLFNAVHAVQDVLDATAGIPNLPLDQMMENLIQEIEALQKNLDNLDQVVAQWLDHYDSRRHSWTAEDGT